MTATEPPKLKFHRAAEQAINQSAMDLLANVVEHKLKPNTPPDFPSNRPAPARITDKEMLDVPLLFKRDIFGNIVARYFPHDDGKIYGLGTDAYQLLRRAADQALKTQWVRQLAGRAYVEDHLFLWCRKSFREDKPQPFTEYLEGRTTSELCLTPVWVPVALLEVEEDLPFGPGKFSPMTAALFDEHEARYIEGAPARADDIKSLFASKREKYQGRAAVVLEIQAVRGYALERAVELAEDMVGLLRLYSPAAAVPWLVCPSAIAGTEYEPNTTAISYGRDGTFQMSQGALKPFPFPWQISTKRWAEISANHLSALAKLIGEGAGLSELQLRLRTSILTYSKGLTMRTPADRLVYSLSALESLFLRDSSEPIQQNLGERLAFLLHKDTAQRQNIVRTVRAAYNLRSRYIHHQQSIAEDTALADFFPIAASALFTTLANVEKFATPLDFIDAIDHVKFGG